MTTVDLSWKLRAQKAEAAIRFVRGHWGHTDLLSQWIRVEDRLPEFPGAYIVAVSGPGDAGDIYTGTLPAEWSVGDKRWYDLRGWGHDEVTHWMPLPAPPTEADPRHKMQPFRSPGDESPYDGPKYLPDERCERCQFEKILERR